MYAFSMFIGYLTCFFSTHSDGEPDIYEVCLSIEEYQNSDPSAAANKARTVLELIVEHLGGTGRNLLERINSLSVPKNIEDNMHTVRIIGNKGSHVKNLESYQIEKVLNALYGIITWITKCQKHTQDENDKNTQTLLKMEHPECTGANINKIEYTPKFDININVITMDQKSQQYYYANLDNDPREWMRLGFHYSTGSSVNFEEALKWYSKAADAGIIKATYEIKKILKQAPKQIANQFKAQNRDWLKNLTIS